MALTVIRLNAVRQKQRFVITAGKNTIVIVVVCVIAFVSSRPSLLAYYDATHTKLNTLTPVSQEIIKKVEGGMTITSYVNVLDRGYVGYAYPRFIMENQVFFRKYTRFKPEIKLKTVYYYAEPDDDLRAADPTGEQAWAKARRVCEIYDVDSMMLKNQKEIDQIVDLSEEGYTFIRQIVRENGQKEWLRVYDYGMGRHPGEAEVTVAFKRMIMTLPKIGYVSGHRERGMQDESLLSYNFIMNNKKVQSSVWNQGYDVEEITLDKTVPEDISLILIADPRDPLTLDEEAVLQAYLNRGGSLFMLGEPRHRDALNPTLRRMFGLELTPMLVQPDSAFKKVLPDIIAPLPTKVAEEKMYELKKIWMFSMPTASGVEQIEDKGFEIFPIAQVDTTKSLCWTELETTDFIDDTVKLNPVIGEVAKKYSTAIGLSKKVGDKEQRIVIVGDADVLSNDAFITNYGIGGLNNLLLLGSCHWLSYGEVPIDVRRPDTTDNNVHMTVPTFAVVSWILRVGIPFVLFVLYLFLWLRRRGR
ncbi:GldG family protein [Butyricimonas synergistica]|uniref:GldG family protein n=1 Tax=Butyricimonas synergistica TaxID=544644 RepID=UPI0003A5DA4E|nr:GldG family protein [Butyricimonas synergistica]